MDISKLVNQAQVRSFNAGDVIFREGEPSTDGLGFVLSGLVGVYKEVQGKPVYLNPVPQSSFFGEIALMLGSPRQATALAEENGTKIIFLNKKIFLEEAQNNFAFLKSLTMTALGRIENLRKELDNYDMPYELVLPEDFQAVVEANRAVNAGFVEHLKNYRSIVLPKEKSLYLEKDILQTQLFLVIEGELIGVKKFAKGPKKIVTYQVGDFLGVMEALDQTSRPFGVYASKESTKVAVLDEDILFRVMHLNTQIFFSFFKSVLLDLIVWQEAFLLVKARMGY